MSKKIFRSISLILALGMLFALVIPASAQLGDNDQSTFYVQNVSGNDGVSVTVKFVNESGTEYTPSDLGGGLPNPFPLDKDEMEIIVVADIPIAELPTGKYSVVISSTDKVAAVARVSSTGAKRFDGSYSGFTSGSNSVIIPTVAYNWGGEKWMGMISVQNLGSQNTDVTVTLNCSNVSTTGTLSKQDLPPLASWTVALKNTVPSGFNSSTVCIASAKITADQPIVAVNNQNAPNSGYTNSFEGYPDGATQLFVPQLSARYFEWFSALNVVKTEPGNTTVTVKYDDGAPNDVFQLTDAAPSKQINMGDPNQHSIGDVRFSANITTNPPKKVLAAIGHTKKPYSSGGYLGFTAGYGKVAIPIFFKNALFWNTSINCQNTGSMDTRFVLDFYGKGTETWPKPGDPILKPGDSIQVFSINTTVISDGWAGSVIVSPTAAGGTLACMVGSTQTEKPNPPTQGDWTIQYNAPSAE